MNVPIRVKTVRRSNESIRFSIMSGIKTLFHNVYLLFTHRLLPSCNGWYVSSVDEEIVKDFSLVYDGDEIRFIKTPEGASSGLEITTVEE
ncbi:MAG: hypothetical protein WC346_09305 [Methanogenium sp.]|jgi:hypothetical protein